MPKPEEAVLIQPLGCSAFDNMSVFDDDAPASDVTRCRRKGANYRFGALIGSTLR